MQGPTFSTGFTLVLLAALLLPAVSMLHSCLAPAPISPTTTRPV